MSHASTKISSHRERNLEIHGKTLNLRAPFTMPCLAESQIQRFFERTLSPSENSAVEEHVDQCAICRKLLRDVASGLPAPTSTDTPFPPDSTSPSQSPNNTVQDGLQPIASSAPPPLSAGTIIENRYLVLDMIGMGGMGRVYAAYDRQLDRKIAIKLLRREREDGHEQLVQEAKALAKLSHPNVVVVHDIGTAFGQTYMAMEYIEGCTLRKWLAEERPDTERILDTYLEAAKGLAAAHAAGMVHRDFKPENVLIGKDGRVRVTDFGLAHALRLSSSESNEAQRLSSGESEHSEALVQTHLEGTPLYIAPERFAGKPSNARSDQFAFGVALYEALYNEYPFTVVSPGDLPKVLQAGQVRLAPKGSRVPKRLRSALLKSLCPDPAQRFATMETLSTALRRTRAGTKFLQLIIPALILAIGGIGMAKMLRPEQNQPVLCQGSERKLEGIWDDARKNAIQNSLLASKLPYAETAWKTVHQSLNRYAESWVAAHREACMATRVYGEQSTEVLDRRTACLETQLNQFSALSQALSEANGASVAKAAEAPQKLSDPVLCKSIEVLRDHMIPPQNAEIGRQVQSLQTRLAKAQAMFTLGRSEEISDETQAIWNEAKTLAYPPLQAETGLLLAMVFRGKKTPAEMRLTLEQALVAAEAGHHERAAVNLWLELANFSIWRDARYDDASIYLKHAEAYLQRMDGNVERLRLFVHRSALYRAQNNRSEALEAARKAVMHAEKSFGLESNHTASALMELGINAHIAKKPEESRNAFRRSIKIAERSLGENHPAIASLCINFGTVLIEQEPSNSEEYLKVFQRAADIGERVGGDMLGQAAHPLAMAMLVAKRYEEALQLQQRVSLVNEPTLAPLHPDRVRSAMVTASAYWGLQRYDEAIAVILKAQALAEAGPLPAKMMAVVLEDAEKMLGPCDKKICKDTLKDIRLRAKKSAEQVVEPKTGGEQAAQRKEKSQ